MTLSVGIVTNYYLPEMGVNTYYLCRGLGRLGVDVTLFCSDRYGKKKPGTRFLKGEIEEPFTVKRVRTAFSVANVPIMYGLSGMLKDKRDGRFELLQTEDAYQLYSLTTARASKRLGVPLLLRHDLSSPPQTEPWKTAYRIFVEGLIQPPILSQACRAVVPTKGARAYLGHLRPELPISIIPFGIDTEQFKPSSRDSQTFEVLTVARLIREKGVIELFNAFALFHKMVPNSRLTLIGRGPLKAELVALAGSLRILDSVSMIDQVRHDAINEYYQACDMFVLPSYEEAPSLSVMEAMASGKPVVATYIPGIVDLIDDWVDGVMVPAGQHLSLYEAMLAVYRQLEAGMCILGDNARTKMVSKFDWAVVSRRMYDEYKNILASQETRVAP